MVWLDPIRRRAKEIAECATDEKKELAQFIADLAEKCDELERKLNSVASTANQALTEARSR